MERHHVIFPRFHWSTPFPAIPRLICCLAFIPVFTVLLYAQHTTRRVPQEYPSIQRAVDAARNGDTVIVDHGLYYENVHIRKSIVLASRFLLDSDASHISATTIDGSRPRNRRRASAVIIEGLTDTTTTVVGLTIRGGSGTSISNPFTGGASRAGGGILVYSRGGRILHNVVVDNRIVSDADWAMGGGIALVAPPAVNEVAYFIVAKNTVERNSVTGEYADGGGIGIYANAHVVSNRVLSNTARGPGNYSLGGGMSAVSYAGATVLIEKNFILNNEAQRAGGIGVMGGSYVYHSMTATLQNNIINGNRAIERCGGVGVWQWADALLVNNTITENVGRSLGSGVDVQNCRTFLLNNLITANAPSQQVYIGDLAHAYHNISEEPIFGDNNLVIVPNGFDGLDDSIAQSSPILGYGKHVAYFAGEPVFAPSDDIFDRPRPNPKEEGADVGAIEFDAPRSSRIDDSEVVKLTVNVIPDTVGLSDKGGYVPGDRSTNVTFVLNDTVHLDDAAIARGIDLPSHDATFLIEFNPVQKTGSVIAVRYTLGGRDYFDNYVELNLIVGYPSLSPGEYELVVRTAHRNFFHFGWGEDKLIVRVPPPWWNTWWFSTLSILVYTAIIVLVFMREIRRNRRERAAQNRLSRLQIESQEAERKRLAAELHDGLGQNLLLASNEIQQFLNNDNGSQEELQQAGKLLEDSIHNVREMSANLHPHQLDRLGFCSALSSMIEAISHASGLKIHHQCGHIDGMLPKESEMHLYRIIQEALSNVVHHAGAKNARVTIKRQPQRIHVEISDDGKGFDSKSISGGAEAGHRNDGMRGFGLSSMSERARIIGGDLSITSHPGGGTTISFSFLIHQDSSWTSRPALL